MSDTRELLRRGVEGFEPTPDAFERVLARRDRKRRNQRIAAGVVGLAVFLAAVWIVTSVKSLDRSETSVVPGGSETGSTQTAVDDGFRGWYQIIARQTLDGCPRADYERRLRVTHVNDTERQFGPYRRYVNKDFGEVRHFRYKSGRHFPWQNMRGSRFALRYDPATDSAVGVRHGRQCLWHVRLVSIGPPAKG